MNKNLRNFIESSLHTREKDFKLRTLRSVHPLDEASVIGVEGKKLINFCSNDYLGIARHPKLAGRSQKYISEWGSSSSSSRLITGNQEIAEKLEQKLADFFEVEACLILNTGYQANTSILPAFADRNSLVLLDKKCHNSLISGAVLSGAERLRFRHNDYSHLDHLLQKSEKKKYNQKWIISESVFSMDGDRSDITKLSELAAEYDANLYIDDAHALGVFGEAGRGLVYGNALPEIWVGTFGKAFGSFGAFVACSSQMKQYLINFCGGFIYSTALPPGVLGSIEAALELMPTLEEERARLASNSEYLRNCLLENDFDIAGSASHIIPVVIGEEQKTLELSLYLENHGFLVSAIRPPTVEPKGSRLRISIQAGHKREHIEALMEHISKWKKINL